MEFYCTFYWVAVITPAGHYWQLALNPGQTHCYRCRLLPRSSKLQTNPRQHRPFRMSWGASAPDCCGPASYLQSAEIRQTRSKSALSVANSTRAILSIVQLHCGDWCTAQQCVRTPLTCLHRTTTLKNMSMQPLYSLRIVFAVFSDFSTLPQEDNKRKKRGYKSMRDAVVRDVSNDLSMAIECNLQSYNVNARQPVHCNRCALYSLLMHAQSWCTSLHVLHQNMCTSRCTSFNRYGNSNQIRRHAWCQILVWRFLGRLYHLQWYLSDISEDCIMITLSGIRRLLRLHKVYMRDVVDVLSIYLESFHNAMSIDPSMLGTGRTSSRCRPLTQLHQERSVITRDRSAKPFTWNVNIVCFSSYRKYSLQPVPPEGGK